MSATLSFPSPTQLKNLAAPVDPLDAATKKYVDDFAYSGVVIAAAAGSNTEIQFNNQGVLGSTSNFTFNSSSNILSIVGNIVSTNANLGNLVTSNYFAGTITTASQPNITSVGTLSGLTVTGNVVISGNLTVTGATEYNNVLNLYVKDVLIEQGGGSNGAALTSDDGKDRGTLLHYYNGSSAIDAFMGWDNSNAEFAFGSNVSVLNEVTTFNTYGNVRANVFLGNLSGSASTVTANNQSNITSLGTLTSLTVGGVTTFSGYTTFSGSTTLGPIGNVIINGGSNGQVLTTNGNGGLSFTTPSSLVATVDNFTGDGTTTQYTLSSSPSSENYTFVTVQGLIQPRSYYTVVGNTLTFSTPPPDTSIVEITSLSGSVVNSALSMVSVPASKTASGSVGQVAHDSSYLYVCVSTNNWIRTAIDSGW